MKRKPTEYEKHLAAIQQRRTSVHLSFDGLFAHIARAWTKRKTAKRRTK
jgi:hypothetical protein